MQKVDLSILAKEDPFKLIGKDWMLVCAGNTQKYNMMTASWGGIGILWNKPVAFVFVRPERYTHNFLEENDHLTLSFYDETYRDALKICGSKSGRDIDKTSATGLTPTTLPSGSITFTQSRLTLDCRKLFKINMSSSNFLDPTLISQFYSSAPGGSFHDIYICEIESLWQ